jgi:hypothetical protein
MNCIQLIGVAVVLATGTIAQADVANLAPGDFAGGLFGVTNTELPELIGASVSDIFQDFTIYSGGKGAQGGGVLYEGTLMTRVVRSNQTGNLTFNYRIMDPAPGFDGVISDIDLTGYSDFETRVEYRSEVSGPGDEGPVDASRSEDGDVINFDFGLILDSNKASRFFFVMTDATEFGQPGGEAAGGFGGALATIYLQSGESVTLNVVGPSPSIPAPGTLLLLSGAGLIGTRRRR